MTRRARVATTQRTTMNKTEAAFHAHLSLQQKAGVWVHIGFEEITLLLGFRCRYTPDFHVVASDGAVTFFEVKGFWRDDARVKIKTAACRYWMYRFCAVKKAKTGWRYEEIKNV